MKKKKAIFFCLKIDIFRKNDFKKKQSICDAKYPNLKLNKNYFNGDKTFFSVKYKKNMQESASFMPLSAILNA